jgi:hypothetical protein
MSKHHGAKGPIDRALAKAKAKAIKPHRRLLRLPKFEKKDYDGNAGEEAT